MGRKSVIALAPSFWGNTTTLAELRIARLLVCSEWKAFATLTTSTFMISQHNLKKDPVYPSGPGALSKGIWWTACFVSSSVNAVSIWLRSWDGKRSSSQLMSCCRGGGCPMKFEKWSCINVQWSFVLMTQSLYVIFSFLHLLYGGKLLC